MKLKKLKPAKSFDRLLKKSRTKPVLVQFYADWCGPCRTLKPILNSLAKKEADKWSFAAINVEKNQQVAAQYQITSIPTVHLIYEGESIASFRGVKTEHTILNWLNTNLPAPKKIKTSTKPKTKTKTKSKNKKRSSKYKEAERSLQQGNIPLATIQLLGALHEEQPDESIVKILLALQFLGKNNPQATQLLMELDPKGELKTIAQQLQSLIELEVDEQDEHSPTSSPYTPSPAAANAKIDLANFDRQLLAQLVHHGINEVRTQQGVSALENHSILEAAANDHNSYQIKHDVLTHVQNNTTKRTVKDRVDSFGGGFRMVGENVQYQGMQLMNWGRQQEVVTDTYLNTAKKLVENWLKSRGHYRNLINHKFQYVGTSVGWNPENHSIFATQVFGS